MSILPASSIGDESTGFYPQTIDQSLRSNDNDSPYLYRDPGSAGNSRTFTYSCWFKRGNLALQTNQNQPLFSAGTGSTNFTLLYLDGANDDLRWYWYNGSTDYGKAYDIVLRDTANWYHLVWAFDTTKSSSDVADRVKVYVNGTRITDISTDYGWMGQNQDMHINTTNRQYVGKYVTNSQYLDGYIAEVNLIDGQQLEPDSFGETKNGVWVPKSVSGLTYGTNGFRLTFADSSSIGDDTSGNGNDYTNSSFASTDVLPDSPTNNFCTMNYLQKGPYIGLSEGNLKVTGEVSTNSSVALGTFAVTSGKWYFEVRQGTIASEFIGVMVKQVSDENGLVDGSNVAQTQGKGVVARYNGNVRGISGELQLTSTTSWSAGDIIGIAFDMDNGAVYFAKNNTYLNSGDPTSGSSKTGSFLNFTVDDTRIATPALDAYINGFVTGNFGQDSSFAGTETAQGNTDGNGKGDFYYTPPSGYLALCSANLPEPTISPNKSSQADDHFDTITYSGSASNQTITTNFQADWLWFKERTTNGIGHQLFDSSRLHSSSSAKFGKKLDLPSTSAEGDSTAVVSQSTNDITLLGGVSTTNDAFSRTYVMWHWKANGGTLSTNNDGSITSSVQANTDAGFSIVTYTGNGSTGTVGHGLGAVPKLMIVKLRSASGGSFIVYHHLMGSGPEDLRMFLDSNEASGTSTANFNSTAPTSTVFSVGNTTATNGTGTYVAYCFAEIAGYSKFGKFIGNNVIADGTFVFVGFKPAFLIAKRADSTSDWFILDNKRTPTNPVGGGGIGQLAANQSYPESSLSTYPIVDFLSNGFKLRHDMTYGYWNASGATYIYWAFADQPFKFSNAE